MTSSRSLVGRISFWWAAGFVVLSGWLVGRPGPRHFGSTEAWAPHSPLKGYNVFFTQDDFLAGFAAGALVCAAVYFALEHLRRAPWRRVLGGTQLAVTFAGVILIFTEWAAPGLLLAVLSQLLFVAVLIDALRPAPDVR